MNGNTTKRIKDPYSGFITIKDNPFLKGDVIVQYLGKEIDDKLEPNKVYNVFRPYSEIDNDETKRSFDLQPWIDEHAMLGENFTETDKKGIDGVIGHDVYSEYPYLKATIKVYSNRLKEQIEKGKRELSAGYFCRWDLTPGVFEGQYYDVVQKDIRGNHIASVDEGRNGSDVAVMDKKMNFNFAFDEASIMYDTKETSAKVADAIEAPISAENEIKKMISEISEKIGNLEKSIALLAKAEVKEVEANALDTPVNEKKPTEEVTDEKDCQTSAMDSKSVYENAYKNAYKDALNDINYTNSLRNKLTSIVGVFDSNSTMTKSEVIDYGIKKLNIELSESGNAQSALEGYLAASKSSHAFSATNSAMDKKTTTVESVFADYGTILQ